MHIMRRQDDERWLLVEPSLTYFGDHLTVSLLDVSEPSELFTPPHFLHEVSFRFVWLIPRSTIY